MSFTSNSKYYQAKGDDLNRFAYNDNSHSKYNQMNNDLARLKNQLNKIMHCAQKGQQMKINLNKSSQINNSQYEYSNPHNYQLRPLKHYLSADRLPIIRNQTQNKINQNINNPQQMIQKCDSLKKISNHIYSDSKINFNFKDKSLLNKKLFEKPVITNQTLKFYEKTQNSEDFIEKRIKDNKDKLNSEASINKKNEFNFSNQNRFQFNKNISKNQEYIKPLKSNRNQKQEILVNKEFKIFNSQPILNIKQNENNIRKDHGFQFSKNKSPPKTVLPSNNQTISFSSLKRQNNSSISDIYGNRVMNEQLARKDIQLIELEKKKREQLQFQHKLIEIQHEKRKLKQELNNALLEKQNSDVMLKTQREQKQIYIQRCTELEQQLRQNKRQLEGYQAKYKTIQRKYQAQLNLSKNKIQNLAGQNSFDQVLKSQIFQITKLKQRIQQSNEEISLQKQMNTQFKRQIDSLTNQIKIEKLKAATHINQIDLKNSIYLQDKDNQIKTLNNLIQTLESKIVITINENKTKDNFMMQHLKGKAKTGEEKEYIQQFLKKYEIEFPTNRILQKLKQEQIQIQKLKHAIYEMTIKI